MVAGKATRLLAGLWLGLIALAVGAFVFFALIAVAAARAVAAITTWAVKRATLGP